MNAFLIKYKKTIFNSIVFLTVVLLFIPKQNDYYLDNDIKSYKQTYLTRILLWTGIVTSIVIFVLVLVKVRSLKQSGTPLISAGVTIALLLFIFQDVFLRFALFLNRQFKRDTLQKVYVVDCLSGTDRTKNNFITYDLASGQIINDEKLKNKIYRLDLKQFDTVKVTFDKGLFGIAFQSQPYGD